MNLHSIFPTPVGIFDLGREFTEKEISIIMGFGRRPNTGNTTSDERYIFKKRELKNLKKFAEDCVAEYFEKVYSPKHEVSLRITQSWANYTEKGQFHHKHEHPNSFVSGVFYVNADAALDKIYFFKNKYDQLKIPPKEWHLHNSDSWWFEAVTGKLMIFPSSLTHMVQTVESEKTRVSISFNTFLKGYVGEENELTALHLGE